MSLTPSQSSGEAASHLVAEPRPGRPEAAAAIWDWKERAQEAAAPPAAGRARLRGGVQALVAVAFGAGLWALSLRIPAFVAFSLGGLVGVSALLAPTTLYAGIERGFQALGHWTGRLLGWLLLVPIFYGFFAPFGLLFRRGRRDRLQRFREPTATSYWEPHEGDRVASASHRRQY
ncbi:MAG: hypothetical protein ABFS46_13085 [Myxococcota bacterium]